MAKERFPQAMFSAAVSGSQAYVSGQAGNAYTDYLRGRYGEWGPEQDAEAIHYITHLESSESPWNMGIGPASANLVSIGIPLSADTRGAMQNLAVQNMHPSRRKQAVLAALSYTYPQAKAFYGNEHPAVFALAHGEMARALPADDLNDALTMYQISGQSDLGSTLAPQFMAACQKLAANTQTDFGTTYTRLATAAPHAARRIAYVNSQQDLNSIHTLSDLSRVIEPSAGQSTAGAMQIILEAASSDLSSMASYGVPLTVVNGPHAPAVFEFVYTYAPKRLNTPSGAMVLNSLSKQLSQEAAPPTVQSRIHDSSNTLSFHILHDQVRHCCRCQAKTINSNDVLV